jgi:CRISPR-associated protein Cas1
MQLLLDTHGLVIKKRNSSFWVQAKTTSRLISPHRVTSIAVTSNCFLSTSAIRLAVAHQIPIYLMDGIGQTDARLWSATFGSTAALRRKQVYFADSPAATAYVVELFRLKSQQQAENLRYLQNRRPSIHEPLAKCIKVLESEPFSGFLGLCLDQCTAALMGHEGTLARQYWQVLSDAMPEPLQFESRSRRPATDTFNAALNYLYGMLYTVVENALFAAGLDPYLGFLHADEYNAATLSFDLIEPFRPWADRWLIENALRQEIKTEHFEQREGGYYLNRSGKQWLIPAFNGFLLEKERFRQQDLPRRSQIYRLAADLATVLRNFEKPH